MPKQIVTSPGAPVTGFTDKSTPSPLAQAIRAGNLLFVSGQGPLDPNCTCRVCTRYSRAYLRHLYAANEVLAQVLNTIHNLSFYLDTMQRLRHSI